MKKVIKQEKRHRRHKRVRAKIFGTVKRPRLCIFRSAKHVYAQLIDDEQRKTLVAATDQELKKSPPKSRPVGARDKKVKIKEKVARSGKVAIAYEVGKLVAKKALDKKIEKVTFDRGGYQYHGRVKALAEGAREEGLKF